jgi:hypothetical protein
MTVFQKLGASIVDPLYALWNGLVDTVPGIIAAIVILLFAYFVALFVGNIIEKLLLKVKLDEFTLKKTNLTKVVGAFKLSHFLGLIAKWYLFILFLPPAANVINLRPLSDFFMDVARWVPNVIAGVIIALVGFMAADYISMKIKDTKAKSAGIISCFTKIVIIVFVLLIALDQIGLKVAIAHSSFLIVLAGIMLGIALMIGIGFGLGLKDEAKKTIKSIKDKF